VIRATPLSATVRGAPLLAAAPMTAHWFTHCEAGGFPIERAILGACNLSVLHIGRRMAMASALRRARRHRR
jgi:hypothetical protein